MPAPTAYTESSLIGFMEVELGPVGEALGLLTSDALLYAVYAVERLLGVAVAAVPAEDLAKLETIARWLAWRAAKAAAAGEFDLSGSVPGLKRSQVFDHIAAMLAEAEAAASQYAEAAAVIYGGSGTAYVTGSGVVSSPYGWAPADEWA